MTHRPRSLVWALWTACAVAIAAIAAVTAGVIRAEQRNALALAQESLSRTAVSMAAHAERVLADAEHRLIEGNILLPLITPEEITTRVSGHGGPEPPRGVRSVSAVILMDGEGIVIAPALLRGQTYAADPLIRAALAAPRQEMLAGDPRESRRTGGLVIPVAMRATANEHGVAVVYTAIALDPFLDLFSLIRPGSGGGAALFREDGMLMARQPFDREEVGRMILGGAVRTLAEADSGVVDVTAETDGKRRLVAFHRAGGFPFFTLVGAERAAVLAAVTAKARTLGGLAVLACLALVAGAAFTTRQLRRDARQVAELEASRAALDRVAMIAEETQAAVVVADRNGLVEWVNPAFTRNSGFSLAEMVGRNPGELLAGPETDPETAARIDAAVREGRPFDVEILTYTKDRRATWIQLVGNPVRDATGGITRFISVQTDITARRAAEARAAEAQRLSALGQLAGGVAHDMNNLLMVISLNLELLAESGLEPQKQALSQAALAATIRGHDLTRQLLSFAQRAADPSRVTDVGALLGTVLPLLARTLPAGIRLQSDLRCHGHCRGDAGMLESAVTNLVVNARDALGADGHIIVECARHELTADEATTLAISAGRYMRIMVSDDGPGIPRDLLGRVLEPFFTTKQGGKGTGLGLSTAYGFARQAGGTLTIESTPGAGTRVSLYLPAVAVDGVAPAAAAEAVTSLRGLAALVVDDEPQILVLLERTLRASGVDVTLALDAVQAQASLDAARPDVLLADVRLAGGQSGVDVVEAARARYPDLPVIFMTGDPGPEFSARIARLADVAVLQKPFSRDGLTAALRAAVQAPAMAFAREPAAVQGSAR
jgi:PAS domain S-box-containing protein